MFYYSWYTEANSTNKTFWEKANKIVSFIYNFTGHPVDRQDWCKLSYQCCAKQNRTFCVYARLLCFCLRAVRQDWRSFVINPYISRLPSPLLIERLTCGPSLQRIRNYWQVWCQISLGFLSSPKVWFTDITLNTPFRVFDKLRTICLSKIYRHNKLSLIISHSAKSCGHIVKAAACR